MQGSYLNDVEGIILWYATRLMKTFEPDEYRQLYAGFEAPIAAFDCGQKCAPYNERGVPFCCDTRHAVPAAHLAEWNYLRQNTDLWHLWQVTDQEEQQRLQAETPPGMVLIECLGHQLCQRGFRSLTCRAFPFFPYINSQGEFLGLSCYWEYQDRCWVANHLETVTQQYVNQFVVTYEKIFEHLPHEKTAFIDHSAETRRQFANRRRRLTLLHRAGGVYQISPRDERLHPVRTEMLPKCGPYRIAALLLFPED